MKVRGGIVFYTDNQLRPEIAGPCRAQLQRAAAGLDIITVGLNTRAGFGEQLVVFGERGIVQMHRQILIGLERARADYVFLTEHDVLYHPSHFTFVPPRADTFYYNTHVWHVRYPDGHAVYYDAQQVSGLCASRELLVSYYQQKVALLANEGFDGHYEPGLRQKVGSRLVENWQADYPNLDIRHGANLTRSKWKPADFKNARFAAGWREADELDGWGRLADLFKVTV